MRTNTSETVCIDCWVVDEIWETVPDPMASNWKSPTELLQVSRDLLTA